MEDKRKEELRDKLSGLMSKAAKVQELISLMIFDEVENREDAIKILEGIRDKYLKEYIKIFEQIDMGGQRGMTNPADGLKDAMWQFLMTKGQKANVPALKEYVYKLIAMTTQKTAGQKKGINWSELDMVLMSIVIEATALVQSGVLDEIEEDV